MKVERKVIYTQAAGCRLCLHIGTIALFFGRPSSPRLRIEVFTPKHWFRWAVFRDGARAGFVMRRGQHS